MATESISKQITRDNSTRNARAANNSLLGTTLKLLAPLASLKLTVALLSLSLLLVLFGTLAQDRMGVWRVVGQYFQSWFVLVPLQIFFPTAWFPERQNVTGGFWFPGGATLGLLMMLNLLTAHLVRFKAHVRDWRLPAGSALVALGALITAWVILRGHNSDGLQAEPPMSWETLRTITLAATIFGIAGIAVFGFYLQQWKRHIEAWISWAVASVIGLGLAVGYAKGWGVDSAGMRILWQLLQGEVAALVLLAGCYLLFAKRAGVVLLHAGIGLLMYGQYYVSKYDTEEQMIVSEGETINYAQDIRCVELAVMERHGKDDRVTAIPLIRAGHFTKFATDRMISDDKLPFDIEVVACYEHSSLQPADKSAENKANAGRGLEVMAIEQSASAGASSDSKVDESSAYIKLVNRKTKEDLGTFLLSQAAYRSPTGGFIDLDAAVTVDGQDYDLTLRFERNYKPYTIRLLDVRKDDYVGTSTPRNYSSTIHLQDTSREVDRENITISMNNPLRYANETFYQSGYNIFRGREITTLQIVRNSGWMIPYVACMIVATGMLAHFGVVLLRYLQRLTESAPANKAAVAATQPAAAKNTSRRAAPTPQTTPTGSWSSWAIPLVVLAICGFYFARISRPPTYAANEMNLYAFGQLPVADHGRVKPLDTLARNSLRIISNSESFKDESGTRQPAIRWLLDVIADTDDADKHKVFRIDNPEVLDLLQLEPRPGFFRYSVEELGKNIDRLETQLAQIRQRNAKELGTFDKKLVQLEGRLQAYMALRESFRPLRFPELPSPELVQQDPERARKVIETLRSQLQLVDEVDSRMQRLNPPPPRVIPVSDDRHWITYASAWNHAYRDKILSSLQVIPADQVKSSESVVTLATILDAYRQKNAREFNNEVLRFTAALDKNPPFEMPRRGTGYESFFNALSPFLHANILYTIALVVTLLGWAVAPLGWMRPVRAASFWLVVGTFALHTLALWQRMEISGRPPITNLYSSAVFIGWAIVLLGLILECLFKIGMGNAIAAIAGGSTLLIGHFLSNDGDTVTVMQAVLDTQFWLATHVVVISLGYSATFAAGLLGILYVLGGMGTPIMQRSLGRFGNRELTLGQALASMIYGILCFATLASFVGTVLGGLWADDSWGRFWGWDPKENGALIIVIWNAIILHARWDGMVRERGVAVLSVVGNIVTAWSWFGVNELGIGLHSYGFTEGRLRYLALFVISQLLLVAIGCLPKFAWWSFRALANKQSGVAGAG
ncbi:MAG: Cytochrome c biosis protein CcsA [Planctomycetota bacterium]